MRTDWKDTSLWQELKKRKDHISQSLASTLQSPTCMPAIEKILSHGGTDPSAFTLHDEGHAFRVAQRMVLLMPTNLLQKMSSFEICLLLLSAYCHDIGMTPTEQKVTAHYAYLLSGDVGTLSENEVGLMQEWLDDAGFELEPPMCEHGLTSEQVRRAQEIVTSYCRFRHNDWSEGWIRDNVASLVMGSYVNWTEHLVALCRSHREGYVELSGDRFAPRMVAGTNQVVHLRYLACLLRVADILEFDPERTPDVIFRHRDIPPESRVYWWRDHYISIGEDNSQLVIHAEPPDAMIHKAILTFLDDVDHELWICSRLSAETHFGDLPGFENASLPHRWRLLPSLRRIIQPKNEAYEYIEGAFKPDAKRLLRLFTGEQLYHNSIAAVRELMQNSLDAVSEMMAYEQLEARRKNVELSSAASRQGHFVELRLSESEGSHWLCCTDTGAGMSKEIIRDHFLVSGAPQRRDLLTLKRRCRDSNIPFCHTGRFGIGVLSYFMLADGLEILTRRSQLTGCPDSAGWQFEIHGLNGFGELRHERQVLNGTRVRMRLRPDVVSDITDWYSQVRIYLQRILRRLPCRIMLRADIPGCEALDVPSGWSLPPDTLAKRAISVLKPDEPRKGDGLSPLAPPDLLPAERTQRALTVQQLYHRAQRSLRSVVREGQLDGGIGWYRVHIPFFALQEGTSLVFYGTYRTSEETVFGEVFERTEDSMGPYDNFRAGCLAGAGVCVSWNGIAVDEHALAQPRSESDKLEYRLELRHAIVELDFSEQAGSISVNRRSLTLSENAVTACKCVEDAIQSCYREYLAKNTESFFHMLDLMFVGDVGGEESTGHWISLRKTGRRIVGITAGLKMDRNGRFESGLTEKSTHLSIIHPVKGRTGLLGRPHKKVSAFELY
jgi:hypothetical protein